MKKLALAIRGAAALGIIAYLSSAPALAEELPSFGKQMILDAGLDQQATTEIASQWPAADLQAVLSDWSQTLHNAISDDAKAILVIETLVGEYTVRQSTGSAPAPTHQAAIRGLGAFIGEWVEEASVVPVAALIKRELGDYAAAPKEANRVGVFDLPAGANAGEIKTVDGQFVMKLANETKVVLPLGRYVVHAETKAGTCDGSIELKGGSAGALSCP